MGLRKNGRFCGLAAFRCDMVQRGVKKQSKVGEPKPQNANFPGHKRKPEKPEDKSSDLVEDDDSTTLKAGTTTISQSMGDTCRHLYHRLFISNEDYVSTETTTLIDRTIATKDLEVSGERSRMPGPGTVRIEVSSTRSNPPDNFRQINSDTLPAGEPNSSRVIDATKPAHTTTQPAEGEDIEGLLVRGPPEISKKPDLGAVVRQGCSLVIKKMTPAVTLSNRYVPRDQAPGFTLITTTISTTTGLESLDETECRHVVDAKTRNCQTQTGKNSIPIDQGRRQGVKSVPPRQFAASAMKRSPRLKQGLLEQLIMESIQSLNINRHMRN
ncbi:unnamed protein product [Dibothriocephalus latus]|uniref:Uncharacterized protein n=1 Tax=Dibothriocephalus latus TaxID=60516 RepID=A0A3P7MMB0_DIBLA|nr:unnamed protein product [Dibothriocephalus latus]